jgi:hypothetical protein
MLHPEYITNADGRKLVALPVAEFDALIEELEEWDDIRAYDTAKKEDDGTRILFSDYLLKRGASNA